MAEEETLGGREGGRWAAQRRPLGGREGSWRFRWEPLGIRDSPPGGGFPPGGLRGGDPTSCAKWLETYRKQTFSKGSRPGPPAGIPASPGPLHRLRRGRFRVLLGATLLPDGCPVGVRRQVWTAQGGLKPPCIVTLSMLQPRIVTMRDCTSARSRATREGGMRACGPGEFRVKCIYDGAA